MQKSPSAGHVLKFLERFNNSSTKEFGSSVAVHKLRLSKWFAEDESRVLCAVLETGFIVEVQNSTDPEQLWFGVALWKAGKEKTQLLEHMQIYTLKDNHRTIRKTNLTEIWSAGCVIRINNMADKDKKPHSEKDIRNQVKHAKTGKLLIWHNSQHFAYWCRYGDRPKDIRRKQMSECVMIGSVGTNVGLLLVNRTRTQSATK